MSASMNQNATSFTRNNSVRNKTSSFSHAPDARRLIQQLNKHLTTEEKDYVRTEALFSFRLGAVEYYTFRQILCNLFLDKQHRLRDVTAFIEQTLLEQERRDLLPFVSEFRAMTTEDDDSDPVLPIRRAQRFRHTTHGSRSQVRSTDTATLPRNGNESDYENTSTDDVIEGGSGQPPAYALRDAYPERGYTSERSPELSSAEEKGENANAEEAHDACANQVNADDVTVAEEAETDEKQEGDDEADVEAPADDDVTVVAEEETRAVSQEAKKSRSFVARMWRSIKSKKIEK